jgi:hypothetical protein
MGFGQRIIHMESKKERQPDAHFTCKMRGRTDPFYLYLHLSELIKGETLRLADVVSCCPAIRENTYCRTEDLIFRCRALHMIKIFVYYDIV